MKGRTICPKCKHEFILDIKEDEKKHAVSCPKCNTEFTIKAECKDSETNYECSWEEHGEPRKTILSKIKPRTNKPMIAVIILIFVFAIGINTALFSNVFVESSLDITSGMGFTGTVKITVLDSVNNSISDANIKIDGVVGTTDSNGVFLKNEMSLGVKNLEVSYPGNKTYRREILVTPLINYEDSIILNEGVGDEELIEFNSSSCTLIILIFSIFALLGAIVCWKRKNFDVAIVGSVIGIFSFGFLFIGSILSLIAFVIIYKSKDEFEDGKKGKTF
jgi:hypothetical protein